MLIFTEKSPSPALRSNPTHSPSGYKTGIPDPNPNTRNPKKKAEEEKSDAPVSTYHAPPLFSAFDALKVEEKTPEPMMSL